MVLHGTGGDGKQFLRPQFADELYGPGQPLDIRRYWIILPDNIGHGKSSKPSDGLRMRFPKYDYDDMVEAQRRMLTEASASRHLRLIMGTSMGCMHGFVWGETYPDFASALMPLACEPIEIAGLNRMWRQLAIDGIEADPAWKGGNYTKRADERACGPPRILLFVAGGAPLYLPGAISDARGGERLCRADGSRAASTALDANDLIYQLDSSRNYNPWPNLETDHGADDVDQFGRRFHQSAQLRRIRQQALKRMPTARFRLIPESAETHGHGTHTWAKFWKADLIALLARSD